MKKGVRATIVCEMAFELFENGGFTEKGVIEKLEISRTSFFRGLSDFRCYLMEFRPWVELIFDTTKSCYTLRKL